MSRDLTPEEVEQVRAAIAGVDCALKWMEPELRRLQRALDAWISLEVIGELNRIIYRETAG